MKIEVVIDFWKVGYAKRKSKSFERFYFPLRLSVVIESINFLTLGTSILKSFALTEYTSIHVSEPSK